MTLGNTPSRNYGFQLEQCKSFAFLMKFHLKEVVDDIHVPYDLTGSIVRMVVREQEYVGGAALLTLIAETVDLAAGVVRFAFQAADLDMVAGEYLYDITLLASNGYSTPVMKGMITVGSNADANSANVYNFTNPNTEISVEIHNGATVEVAIKNPDFIVGPIVPIQVLTVLSDEPPANPEVGTLWIDSNGVVEEGPVITVGPTAPGNPTINQLWLQTS